MKKAVFCLTKNQEQTNRIIERLKSDGFANEDVSVLFAEKGKLKKQTPSENYTTEENPEFTKHPVLGHEKHTKAPEGATTGTIAGGIIGGAIGLLIGLGAITIPGLGAFIVAGPLFAALGGAAVLAGVGLITGALIGLGIPEFEAKMYENRLKEGHILVCVHCDTNRQTDRVKEIFKECEGEHICSADEVKVHS